MIGITCLQLYTYSLVVLTKRGIGFGFVKGNDKALLSSLWTDSDASSLAMPLSSSLWA
jgi:hypothetical protein